MAERNGVPPATAADERFVAAALALAERGLGRTHPNPMVGAVVVRGGRVVGGGWHRRAGGPHAEVEALRHAGPRARGGTMYVTLEPCAHFGRTPPCVDALLEAGVRRVVVAVRDPHPLVRGRGVRALRRAGVQVDVGAGAAAARALNAGYFKAQARGLPWVTLKLAASLDGKIAPASRRGWLTGAPAVREAHRARARHDAVLIGAGTARLDDPRLTVRAARGDDPLRVIATASLVLPIRARLLAPPLAAGTVVATVRPRRGVTAWERRRRWLEARGVRVWVLAGRGARVPLRALLLRLAAEEAHHVLVEGGAQLAGALLRDRLVDELRLFTAPLVLGEGVSWASGARFETGTAPRLLAPRLERIGGDWLVSGRVSYGVHGNRGGDRSRSRRRPA
jgi:diaminohydroxyphosphoribosylaminopyrimidine deaminase/5-amino-6-(5-phosphoribosylamino)uracil reductase